MRINTFRHRGDETENLINSINYIYLLEKTAVIDKIPTPIKVLSKDKQGFISKACFEKDSTVDYYGSYNSISFCFDAKETLLKNLPLKNIHAHQVEYMKNFNEIGKGFSFILCHEKTTNTFYFITLEKLLYYWENQFKENGRKSIPFAELKDCIIPKREGLPNYIVCLKRYIEERGNKNEK